MADLPTMIAVHLAPIRNPGTGWSSLDAVIAAMGQAIVPWSHDGPMISSWMKGFDPKCPREQVSTTIGIWIWEDTLWRRAHPVELRMLEHGLLEAFWMLCCLKGVPLSTDLDLADVARWAQRPSWQRSS